MSVRQNIPGRRPDDGHGPSGRTTVRQDFAKILRENLSCLRADGMAHRPDGHTPAASNFLIRLSSVRTMGMNVRTAILQHAISISPMRASGP